MEERKEEKYWYVTKALVEQITEGKCLLCGIKMKEEEIEEVIKEKKYKEAGICRNCRKKLKINGEESDNKRTTEGKGM